MAASDILRLLSHMTGNVTTTSSCPPPSPLRPQLAEIHPKFVRSSLSTVLETMMTIAEAEALEESTRKLAAEFVVTLCEAREQAPGMMRKIPQLNHRLFMCFMNYLLDVEVRPPPPRLPPSLLPGVSTCGLHIVASKEKTVKVWHCVIYRVLR